MEPSGDHVGLVPRIGPVTSAALAPVMSIVQRSVPSSKAILVPFGETAGWKPAWGVVTSLPRMTPARTNTIAPFPAGYAPDAPLSGRPSTQQATSAAKAAMRVVARFII